MNARNHQDLRPFARRVGILVLIMGLIVIVGTIGFAIAEHISAWQGFRWTLDTVATEGSLVDPQTTFGQVLQVALIVVGVGTLFGALATVTEFFVAGHLADVLERRRMQRMIDASTDHFIICGYGRVGRQVARDLRAAGARYVVIDPEHENRSFATEVGVRFIEGSASSDENLLRAGIERARAVIACVDSDAENIFITLSARELNPGVAIVARSSDEHTESKLLTAGADRVISPYKSSGSEMARLALHPQVSGAIEVADDHRLEEILVSPGCPGSGKRIDEVRGGAFIVGVKHADGSFEPQPPPESVLCDGDVLMALGTPRTMERLEALFEPAARSA
jgi:voltage-gated potassium channel